MIIMFHFEHPIPTVLQATGPSNDENYHLPPVTTKKSKDYDDDDDDDDAK